MSFDWNLSSDEEEGFDGWAKADIQEVLSEKKSSVKETLKDDDDDAFSSDNDNDDEDEGEDEDRKPGAATVPFFSSGQGEWGEKEDDDDDDDDDEIDWEDAATEHGDQDVPIGAKLASDNHPTVATLKPVTVDWNQTPANDKDKNKKGKQKMRGKYRFDRLPPEMKQLLTDLERTHLLSLTSHTLYVSKSCSEDELLHMAHSIVPEHLYSRPSSSSGSSTSVPSEATVNQFCAWYFELVNKTQERLWRTQRANRAAGAPRQPLRMGRCRKRAAARAEAWAAKQEQEWQGTVPPMDDDAVQRCCGYCTFLSNTLDDDLQQLEEITEDRYKWTHDDKVHLLVAMAR
jgi:hypothetical protein